MLWRISARTGVRRGEVVGLTRPDVDLDAGRITINQTIQIDNRSLYVKGPKSKNGTEPSASTLRHTASSAATGKRMLHERAVAGAAYQVEPLGHDFVFRADEAGSPLNPDWFTAAFKREWAHANLPPGPTLHGLRHTNGSLLLNGVPPIHVAAHLGHDLQTLNKVSACELNPTNRQEVIARAVADIYG